MCPLQQAVQKKPKRIASIQVCRGLAALLVVLAHLHGIENKYFGSDHMLLFEHGALGVDLFFVISGVVIASVTSGKFGTPRSAGVFLYHRLVRIFPIFWIYTTLSLFARYYDPLSAVPNLSQQFNVLASYLLIPTSLPMILLQGWTLSYELYFYLVFFLLLFFVPEKTAPWCLALWGIAVVALKLAIPASPWPVLQLLISPSVLEFLSGCIIFHFYRRSRLHPSIGAALLFLSLLWITGVIAFSVHAHAGQTEWITEHSWNKLLLYGSFAALFLLGTIELERTGLVRYLPFLQSIGDWSYSIYLSHILVIELVARLCWHLLPGHGSILIISLISIPASVFLGYLSFIYIERPLLNRFHKRPDPPRPSNPVPQDSEPLIVHHT